MVDLMKEQKLYLEARLRECETSSELNKNQIAEYRKYLDLLASSKDADGYADRIAATGDMFTLSQAEQLDHYENSRRIKELFGDEQGAAAEGVRIDAVQHATGHTDLYDKVTATATSANDMIAMSQQAVEQVMNLFTALVIFHTSCAGRKAEKKAGVVSAWNRLKSLDPEITFEKIMSYPPYRSVLPFDDGRLGKMKDWLGEVLR